MAVHLSNGCAPGAELLEESIILVGLHYDAGERVGALAGERAMRWPDIRPHYDPHSRKLWFGGALLKHIKRAENHHELILNAFDEEGWPAFIYDPLPPERDVEPRRRLHDAVYAMNQSIAAQAEPRARYFVRFHVRDCGTAICWEVIDAAAVRDAHASSRVWPPEPAVRRLGYLRRRCK